MSGRARDAYATTGGRGRGSRGGLLEENRRDGDAKTRRGGTHRFASAVVQAAIIGVVMSCSSEDEADSARNKRMRRGIAVVPAALAAAAAAAAALNAGCEHGSLTPQLRALQPHVPFALANK